MLYQSTRDDSIRVDAATAVVSGIAADGGLFVPTSIPNVSMDSLVEWAKLGYTGRAVEVLSLFFTDFTRDELRECVSAAYNKEKFETDSIAPLYKLDDSLYVQELWHGPTCAFKDMALQLLPHLLTHSMLKTNNKNEIAILVATSGDTGKAALEGFRDVPKTRIVVFYPRDGVSEIQKLQMTTQGGKNVYVCAVDGNFDVAQTGVKKIFADSEMVDKLKSCGVELTSANSINWGRLAPQIVYYFSAYCDLLKNEQIKPFDTINIAVPTGNFGNILAAYYAKLMGLPVHKLICASNCNNVLTDFIKTGVYNKDRQFYNTISPSMDILVSSNLERLLFHVTNGNVRLLSQWMQLLNESGRYEVTTAVHEALNALLWAGYCDDTFTQKTIKDVENAFSYVVDPHTAVAIDVYWQYLRDTGDKRKTVVASTASPFKFNKSVYGALLGNSQVLEGIGEFELLDRLSKHANMRMPASLSQLSRLPVLYTGCCNADEMPQVVLNHLT